MIRLVYLKVAVGICRVLYQKLYWKASVKGPKLVKITTTWHAKKGIEKLEVYLAIIFSCSVLEAA